MTHSIYSKSPVATRNTIPAVSKASIMSLILRSNKDRSCLTRLCITKAQADLVNYTRNRGTITSHEAAEWLDCTVQNAATKLRNLYDLGYLVRIARDAESGGVEYLYALTEGIR